MSSLSGIRVLDLGRVVAAPWCAQVLADLGAEVIKIERTGRGDELRHYGPSYLKPGDGASTLDSGHYLTVNRNKKSVTVDFSKPEGAALVRDLARLSDIVIENYKVGDLARYGLDYASLREDNPGLIYCSITGFGQDGPYARRPGLDALFQGMSGMMSVTGEPDGNPQRVGIWVIDELTAMFATTAILAALRHREVQGGNGQYIDTALLDVGVAAMAGRSIEYFLDGTVPQRLGSRAPGSAPAQLFACADGLLNIQAGGEDHYRSLCDVLGHPELKEDTRFRTRVDRVRHEDQLIPLLGAAIAGWQRMPLYEALVARGVICGPVYGIDEVPDDPQVKHRGLYFDVPHPSGTAPMIASPIRMTETPVVDYRAPPQLGQHTDEILGGLLGLDGDAIARLRQAGIV